jgi:enoyl-CoA hydratase/long-chain 3-hydroxyacyl-CoA dehydrogenase
MTEKKDDQAKTESTEKKSAARSMVTLEVDDGVAIIRIDDPEKPVNTLSDRVSSDFEKAFDEVAEKSAIKAAVLISGKKDNFIAGADIDMLKNSGSAKEVEELALMGHRLFDRMEKHRKPVVAAIHGACLGGGLEVALACDYRICTDDKKTVLALPEVMLGLLPGGGGTQRLPRLVGAQAALDMMLTGKNIRPGKAKKMGLVDYVVQKDGLLQVATEAARRLADGALKRKKREPSTGDKALEETPPGRALLFKQARSMVMAQTGGLYPAPLAILEVVEHGLSKGIEKGLALEAERFGELSQTAESQSLISLFFGQTALKKNRFGKSAREVRKLGVLGAGLMGAGIGLVSAQKGTQVLLKDISLEGVARGEKAIYDALTKRVKRRALSAFARNTLMSRVTGQIDYAGFDRCELVIEAVFEDLDLKHRVLKETEAAISDHCVFASNTSALPIGDIAAASKRPENVLGMHYFSPVQKMPLLEIITTEKTSKEAAALAVDFGIRQGKTVIVVGDGPGFYTTRILAPYMDEAAVLMLEGMDFHRLDAIMKAFGFPVGPVVLLDEVGIDVGAHVGPDLAEALGERMSGADPNALLGMVEKGFLGRKSGKGFYIYDEEADALDKVRDAIGKVFGGGKKEKPVNPEARKLLDDVRQSKKIVDVDPTEVQERMALRFINEAVLCLQEGILQNPTDGDIGAVFGLGFPPMRGGPFRHIDVTGPSRILSDLQRLEGRFGSRFTPAQLLVDTAKAGKTFHAE